MPRRSRCLIALFVLSCQALLAQIPGINVNMVSGTSWPDGDPFLQRQNEPSLAVSSRNPLHLLGGANDYRTVDLPGLPNGETGDAWLGVFKSYDGGLTWKSTLHPGCPQNVPQCAGAAVLKGYAAAADPVVRPGTNGMFYYSGIAFTRTSPAKSVVFVSRFIDNNNEENGDPIKFVSTAQVAAGTATSFVDKPWMAVDVPRAGAATCTVAAPQSDGSTVQQSFLAGNIYLAYTTFQTDGQPPSQIQFSRSIDCGATWSKPVALSDNVVNQGAALAIDPVSGALYIAWRRFANGNLVDAIMLVKSTDGGQTFTSPLQIATINPFDQGTTDFSFRTSAYPAMAVDGAGRVYLAWAERGMGAGASGGDARIVLTTSKDGGNTWTPRRRVNDPPGRGHQYMPAMTFGGGKLMIVFYDLREDNTTGNFAPIGQGQYVETRVPAGDLAAVPPHPEKVFTPFILDAAPANLNEGGLLRRHTVDVWAAQADPSDGPSFATGRVSQYVFGSLPGSNVIEQLQVNPPNFPLFSQGTVPFAGDYLDIAASPAIVPGNQPGTWKFNIDPSPSVVFHAAWADNRDVHPPADGDWTNYTPPVSASTTGLSLFDPSKPQPSCITGQTGMRNENIYTSTITQGLVVSSPSNSKTLGKIQRSFPVVVSNSSNLARTFRLSIVNQPPGGKASFLQFPTAGQPDPLTVLDVSVAPLSSISRMVFVTSSAALPAILVNVGEVSAPGASGLKLGGLQGSLLLNPDPSNPANATISQAEIFNPAIANPAIANPAIANPAIANPAIANPAIANPAIANPAIANLSTSNADIANPAIANPAIANPAIANPAIANTSITDANWALTNNGNSEGTYSVHLLTSANIPSRVLPQVILNKVYNTPIASGCSLMEQPQTQVIANVSSPPIIAQQNFAKSATGRTISAVLRRHKRLQRGTVTDRDAADPASNSDITDSSLDDVTVTIGPGETVYVTLRFFNTDGTQPLGFDPGQDITVVSVSHAADTGSTQPPVASSHLIAATGPLPAGVVGSSYDEFLLAAGGKGPYTWSLVSGKLPSGLTLSGAGEISGKIAGPGGAFNFVVQLMDSSNGVPVQEALTIQVSGVGLAFANVVAAGPGGMAVAPGQTVTVSATVVNSGWQADNITPSITVNSTGTASTTCGGPSPSVATIANSGQQVFTFTCGPVAGSGALSFSVSLQAFDNVLGAALDVSPATSNTVNLLGTAPAVTVTATAGGIPYGSGTWTNQNVLVNVLCTPAVGQASSRQIVVSSEGANQSVSTSCTDSAGNTTPVSFAGIFIDKTPPVVTAAATVNGAPYLSGTVTNQPVTVTFTCTDSLSGVASAPSPQLIKPPAVGQSATGTCTDVAGNVGTATFGGITTLAGAPTMSVSYSNGYTPGAWSSQPVTVTFLCTPANGVTVASLTSPVTLNAQGANQSVTGRCTDSAGNAVQITAGPINIETAPPQLTLQSAPRSASGWFNAPVTLTWICADILAGTQTPINRTVSTEGANQLVSVTCSNQAGVQVSGSQTVSIDLTKPVLTGTATPAAGPTGWNTSPVTVAFACTDALSGVAPGYPTGNATLTTDTQGAIVNGACADVAGNQVTAAIGPIRIDSIPPAVRFLSPADFVYPLGSSVAAVYSCSDAGSGLAGCVGTAPQGQILQLNTPGTFTFTVTATDVAGNQTVVKHTYTVR